LGGPALDMTPLTAADLWGSLFVGLAAVICFLAEHRHPLRARVRPLRERVAVNLPMVALAALTLRLVMIPAALAVATAAERAGVGLLRWMPLPAAIAAVAGFLLLDWSVYVWHRLNHRVAWLWRFHLVHHTDLDLDVTTAFRFHVGELLLSVAWRTLAIAAIGAGPALLLGYEAVTQAATAFHHSNWALPAALERRLNLLLVTPAMHGIHHSVVERETNSNWSVVLSWWDRLHATLRRDPPNETLTIGLPAWRRPRELSVVRLLALPFTRQPPAWTPR
jgi:sterol desaturase/sphingolipid hydroxylase (fatty acid hydroxylase superfamily)